MTNPRAHERKELLSACPSTREIERARPGAGWAPLRNARSLRAVISNELSKKLLAKSKQGE